MEIVKCDHEWTDDGGFLLACTKCGAQEDHDPKWRDMESAPKDGTLIRLLVSFDEHSTEDADEAPTIGANNFDNDEEDVWRFAGWCWTHDHFTQGVGTPVGWLPMIDVSHGTSEIDRVTAEREALQLLLNNRDDLDDQLTSLEQRRYAEQQAREAAERDAERYRWLRKVTPYRFKKIQDAAVTDGGDVMYFHSDRFDAAVDAAIEASLNPTAEAVSHE